MLSPDEVAERRALQAKAYGRAGELSLEEGTRLRELERRHRAAVSVDAPAAVPAAGRADTRARETRPDADRGEVPGQGQRPAAPAADLSALVPNTVAEPEASDGPPLEPAEPVDASSPPTVSRIRRLRPFAAAAAALVVGVAVGWTLWGFNGEAFQLASAHSQTREELESTGQYDPGSVVAVAEQHGVVVWTARRGEGEQQCIVLTSEAMTNSGCGTAEGSYSGTASATIVVPEGDELAGQTFSAHLVTSAAGEFVPTVQIWDARASGWEAQFSDDELEAIDRLEEAGYSPTELSILGYDGELPVWLVWEGQGVCLVAETDSGVLEGCVAEVESDGELTVEADIDGVPTRYRLTYGEMRGLQLTVMKLPSASEPSLDAPEINDTTGESTP